MRKLPPAERARRDRESQRRKGLKVYGLTPEEYQEMWDKQKGLCRICHRLAKTKRLGVDHNHKTHRVRGLLCVKCNGALGWYEEFSGSIAEYLIFTEGHGDGDGKSYRTR